MSTDSTPGNTGPLNQNPGNNPQQDGMRLGERDYIYKFVTMWYEMRKERDTKTQFEQELEAYIAYREVEHTRTALEQLKEKSETYIDNTYDDPYHKRIYAISEAAIDEAIAALNDRSKQ